MPNIHEIPDDAYDSFPPGADDNAGPAEGFNTIVRLNDPTLFTGLSDQDARYVAIKAFLEAPIAVYFVQLKSSHREAEWYVHAPDLAFAGKVEGISGSVSGFPDDGTRSVGTYVINHHATLAKSIMRALIVDDGAQTGQIVHKQPE